MLGQAKRLVICSPCIPQVSGAGSPVVFYRYIEGLKQLGFDIFNLVLSDPAQATEEALHAYAQSMAKDGQCCIWPIRSGHPIPRSPFRHGLEHSPNLTAAVKAVRAFSPDAVFCIDLGSAWVCRDLLDYPTVVWLGDLNFQTFWYHTQYYIKERLISPSRWPYRFARTWVECQLWKKVYRNVLRDARSVVVCAQSSVAELAKLGISSQYLPYPWPDSLSPGQPLARKPGNRPTFVFFGTLAALGSRSALQLLLKEVYPLARRHWGPGAFDLLIAGTRQLPEWAKNQLVDKPEVKYLGFVPDLTDLLSHCHGVLVPIDVPVGNRTRILHSMSGGALVIAHANVALGNPDLVNGTNCYLAANAADFFTSMLLAYECPEKAQAIVEAARQTYEQRFSPEFATRLMANELLAVMGRRQKQAA
jgi:glycosyltransferase involved in cell wall biosynthesis